MTQNVLTNDEAVTGSNHFFRLFSLFLKGTVGNKLQGYFCPSSNINPPYCIRYRYCMAGIRRGFQISLEGLNLKNKNETRRQSCGSGIRDPVLLPPGSGSGMNFFRIRVQGSGSGMSHLFEFKDFFLKP
jgi:hypothetical protein